MSGRCLRVCLPQITHQGGLGQGRGCPRDTFRLPLTVCWLPGLGLTSKANLGKVFFTNRLPDGSSPLVILACFGDL